MILHGSISFWFAAVDGYDPPVFIISDLPAYTLRSCAVRDGVLNLLLRPLFLCNRGGGGRRGKSFDTFNLAQFKLRKRDILMRSRETFGGASALALLNRNAQGFLPRHESLKKF